MAYVPPDGGAVNLDSIVLYSPPGGAAVQMDCYKGVYVVGGSVSSAESVGGGSVCVIVDGGSVVSAESVGGGSVGLVEDQNLPAQPSVTVGAYSTVDQRTRAYAYNDNGHYELHARWDGRYSNRRDGRITSIAPTEAEDIDAQDRLDLLDIYTAFRDMRKAA